MIIRGDCIEEMKLLKENSVDAIVTDPPYNLSSIVKRFGKKDSAPAQFGKDGSFSRLSKGFMGKEWDNEIAFKTEIWIEALRVLKPGGFLLSFGGTRTYHRLVCGIEDAGFEIRDTIMWLYGSGFPKSLNIGKQIDKMQGNEREVVDKGISGAKETHKTYNMAFEDGKTTSLMGGEFDITKGNSEWEGWGTALKPACEPIVVARKPLSEKNVALNVLKWGTGGINIDACRVGTNGEKLKETIYPAGRAMCPGGGERNTPECKIIPNSLGRFPANIILDEEAGKMLDEQSGVVNGKNKKYSGYDNKFDNAMFDVGEGAKERTRVIQDKGGASRFFMNIPKENIYNYCSLCYNTLHKDTKEEWKNINANNVKKNLITTQVIKENSVQQNVMQIPRKKLDQVVRCVGNLCQKCTTDFVQNLVVILENQKDVQSQEGLQVIQDFTSNYKKCILLQNLVDYVKMQDNIDTTQITQNLLKLFGSVQVVIKNYIQEIEKLEPRRFLYQAKASKSERNLGCEDLGEKPIDIQQPHNSKDLEERYKMTSKNNHPTVKPLSLIQYLIKLVSKEGATILDPFLGSGTTAIASLKSNRKFIGIEKEEEYIKICEARIKPFLEQQTLSQSQSQTNKEDKDV